MKYIQTRKKQQGLTLVEIMVAMTIGLVLLGGVATVMSSSQSTYRVNETVARMQESARYAFQLLSRDIRMAGYRGCRGDIVTINNVLNGKTNYLWNFEQPLEGFEARGANSWAPALPSEVTSPLKERDIIVVRGVEGNYSKVISHTSESADLVVGASSDIAAGDTVLVSNCQGTAIFKATDVSNASGQKIIAHAAVGAGGSAGSNASAALGKPFKDGEVVQISTRSYYIRNNPAGIPSLYWKRGSQRAEELVEGIENMQIQYGEDTDGDKTIDVYHKADEVTNWENVVSVRIDLLVQSVEDNITSQPQPYVFDGEDVTPTDRRLRQTFSTVIALRNRAL